MALRYHYNVNLVPCTRADEESKSPFDLENSLDWHSVSAAATASSLENFQNAHMVEHSLDTGNVSPPPSVVDCVELHHQRFVRSVAGEIPRKRSFPTAQRQEVHESTNVPTEHGAFEVVKITCFGSVPYEVPVPDKVVPGDEFAVQAGNCTVHVRIPVDFELGTLLFTIYPDCIKPTFEIAFDDSFPSSRNCMEASTLSLSPPEWQDRWSNLYAWPDSDNQ